MPEPKKSGLLVVFPVKELTEAQQRKLKDALKSMVVAVLSDRSRPLMRDQPKVKTWDGEDC